MTPGELILLLSSTTSSGIILLAGLLHLRGTSLEMPREEPSEFLEVPTEAPPPGAAKPPTVTGMNQKMVRLLLEREILSHAITRIYEAEAEGKISEDEREEMVRQHEFQLREVNQEISTIEKYARLEQLERERSQLLGTTSHRVREIEREIEKIRRETGLTKAEEKPEKEEEAKKKKRPSQDLEAIMEKVAEAMREMEKIEREE
ncbi:MAG: hypothetical protein ACE5GD_01120 [Candidatus Geothermarchaeales archaeon]